MGLFDTWFKKQGDAGAKVPGGREFARFARLVSDKMSQTYDRQEAIEKLSKLATADSAAALLKRFSWSMEPSITDQEEKESAAQGVVAAGEAALEPLRAYCVKAESITWPLKILRQIVDESHIVEELLGILDEFDTEYQRNVEPKKQLLAALEEYPGSEVREAIEPFLTDISEPVRFAAVTSTFAMRDEAAVPALLEALVAEESLRIKNRIAQGLAERDWKVPADVRSSVGDALPPDFELSNDIIRRLR